MILASLALGAATLPAIIPAPSSMQLFEGSFELTAKSVIVVNNDTAGLGETLRGYLTPATGFQFPLVRRPGNSSIILRIDKRLSRLGAEGYDLRVDERHIEIDAANPAGGFYGIQTLRQLLPIPIFRRAPVGDSTWSVPFLNIEDVPRFSWRGVHLDVARHFMPKGFILKFLDLMALHKLNTFHWHLTDDQGWRIEIKKYPDLTRVGAFRKDSMLTYSPPTFEGKPHGGFYTQDDIREVVAYAAKQFITVVPEIEMPGHSQAALAAYPELGNSKKPTEVPVTWGVIEDAFNVEDSTVKFLQDVLTETISLFPSKFIHVGGDEVPKKQWHNSAEAQDLMQRRGLKDEQELQSWFIHQMDSFLTANGRRLIGWDEILEGGLAPGATVMSWRGEAGGIAAAKAGHDVVMAPSAWTYFDHYQAKDHSQEPHAIGGYLPLQKVYGYEPIPAAMTSDEAKHVLGAQAQIWTEYIPTPKQVEYMAFPRLSALSEVLWSPKDSRNYADFQRRLEILKQRFEILGVNFRPPQDSD
jgi:hexosaminidase